MGLQANTAVHLVKHNRYWPELRSGCNYIHSVKSQGEPLWLSRAVCAGGLYILAVHEELPPPPSMAAADSGSDGGHVLVQQF